MIYLLYFTRACWMFWERGVARAEEFLFRRDALMSYLKMYTDTSWTKKRRKTSPAMQHKCERLGMKTIPRCLMSPRVTILLAVLLEQGGGVHPDPVES